MLWTIISLCALGAIVNGPLFSLDASGAIGKALVYSKWKGRNVVREYVTPANPNSIAQRARRSMVALVNKIWATMDETDKDSWASRAAANNISLFNAMTGFNMNLQTDGFTPTKNEGDTPTVPTTSIDTASAVGGANKIDFTVNTFAVEAGAYCVIALDEGTTAPGLNILKMIGAFSIADSVENLLTITGLDPGVYSLTAFLISDDGGVAATGDNAPSITVTGI